MIFLLSAKLLWLTDYFIVTFWVHNAYYLIPVSFLPNIFIAMCIKIFKKQQEKRKYIRHPIEIPIDYQLSGENFTNTNLTQNISLGGLCFQANSALAIGTMLNLSFPSINSDFKVVGKVVWCSKRGEKIEVGVQFQNENDAYHARMIEEICHLQEHQIKNSNLKENIFPFQLNLLRCFKSNK